MTTRPLLEENATEFEKRLLRAGRTEESEPLASARLLGVLQGLPPAPGLPSDPGQIPASLGSGMAASTAVKSASVATWVKIGVLAVGVGGAGVATHRLARPYLAPSAPPVQQTHGSKPVSPPRVAPSVEPIPELTIPRAAEPPAEGNARVRKAPSTSRSRETIRESIQEPSPTPPDHSLAVETSALDRARASLEAHRFAEALRLLGEYQNRFPQGRMRPEATVLRLTALIKSGQHEAAQSLADRLLGDDTYKTYAPRIRSLLKEIKQ